MRHDRFDARVESRDGKRDAATLASADHCEAIVIELFSRRDEIDSADHVGVGAPVIGAFGLIELAGELITLDGRQLRRLPLPTRKHLEDGVAALTLAEEHPRLSPAVPGRRNNDGP